MNNENLVKLPKQVEEINSHLDSNAKIITDACMLGANPIVADNTQFIQQALDNAGHVVISQAGIYNVKRLVIKSNTVFELKAGVKLRLKDNTSDHILVNENWKSTTKKDYNIEIIGGEWDGNMTTNPATGGFQSDLYPGIGVVLNNIQNLKIRNIVNSGNYPKYCFLIANAENVIEENIRMVNGSDGLHHQAPCKNIDIRNITGATHDNMIAFTIGDYTNYVISENGDFENITINNVYSDLSIPVMDLIRFVGDGKNGNGRSRNVTINNVIGNTGTQELIKVLGADQAVPNAYLNKTIVENMKLSNLKKVSSTNSNILYIDGRVNTLELDKLIDINSPSGANRSVTVFLGENSNVTNLKITNSYIENIGAGSAFFATRQQVPVNIIIDDSFVKIDTLYLTDRDHSIENTLNIKNSKIIIGKLLNLSSNDLVNLKLQNCDITTTDSTKKCIYLNSKGKVYIQSLMSSIKPYLDVAGNSVPATLRINCTDLEYNYALANLTPQKWDKINCTISWEPLGVGLFIFNGTAFQKMY